MEENITNKIPHNIILQNRKNLSVSGVAEVISFDDEVIVMKTSMGELTITGENLHITKTNVETGELILDGDIAECIYSNKSTMDNSNNLLKKIFNRD